MAPRHRLFPIKPFPRNFFSSMNEAVDEISVGINAYANGCSGFTGILKQVKILR